MMKTNSRFLLIAIPLVILLSGAVVYRYGYLGVREELTELQTAEQVKSKTLKSYVGLIADKPRIEAKLAALKEARRADAAKLIEEQTAPLAAAALQRGVKEIIMSRGGSVSSERVEKPEDAGKFKIVTATMDGVVPDIRALADTLQTVEMQTPYLVVRELDARIRNLREPRDLSVKLRVSGLTEGR